MNVEDVFNNGLTALLPVYDDGNVTRVFTHNGEQALVRKTCKTVLKNLARFYGVDLAATRSYYGRIINKKQGVPIPMTANLLLIPVKVRENPLGENDGTLGYLNFQEIKQVTDGDGGHCHIAFKCNKDLLVLVSHTTMKEYMKNARLVENLYLSRHFQGFEGAHKPSSAFHESEAKYITDEAFLREYLLELLLEIIRKQKNQAAK